MAGRQGVLDWRSPWLVNGWWPVLLGVASEKSGLQVHAPILEHFILLCTYVLKKHTWAHDYCLTWCKNRIAKMLWGVPVKRVPSFLPTGGLPPFGEWHKLLNVWAPCMNFVPPFGSARPGLASYLIHYHHPVTCGTPWMGHPAQVATLWGALCNTYLYQVPIPHVKEGWPDVVN